MPLPGNNLRDNAFMMPMKPCPFCGSHPVCENHDDNGWFCGCTLSACEFNPSGWWSDELAARTAWNERPN